MPVAAIIAKEGTVVSEKIVEMLEAMRYNKDRFAIATNGEVARTEDPSSLSLSPRMMAIGCSGSSLSNAEFMSSNLKNELSLVLEGYALDPSLGKEIGSSSELVLDLIDQRMRNSDDLGVAVKSILPVLRGAYSFAVTGGNKIVVARDVLGFEPLYWG
jgi:glutamine phosphoribosylpyrophosphate amidotransferase